MCLPIHENFPKKTSTIQCKYPSHHPMAILAPASASQNHALQVLAQKWEFLPIGRPWVKRFDEAIKKLGSQQKCRRFCFFYRMLANMNSSQIVCMLASLNLPEFLFEMNLLQICWCYLALVGGCYFDLFWTSIFQYSPRDPWTSKKCKITFLHISICLLASFILYGVSTGFCTRAASQNSLGSTLEGLLD